MNSIDNRTPEQLLSDWKMIVQAVFSAEHEMSDELDKYMEEHKELDNKTKLEHYCEIVAKEILKHSHINIK